MCEPVTLGVLTTALTAAGTGTAAGAAALGMSGALTAAQALTLGATLGSGVMAAGSMYQQGQMQSDHHREVAGADLDTAARTGRVKDRKSGEVLTFRLEDVGSGKLTLTKSDGTTVEMSPKVR